MWKSIARRKSKIDKILCTVYAYGIIRITFMDIELFVSPQGHVVFTCHSAFEQEIDHIKLDVTTGIVTFVFAPDYEEMEMNCVVHEDLCKKTQNQLFCALGYFKDGKLVASEYARFAPYAS